MSINYEKLSEKLSEILEYDYCYGRPEDICQELMVEYGRYYDRGIVYHGASCHTEEDVRRSYYGLISCSYDKEVAESFAQSYFSDTKDEQGSVFKADISGVFCLDVQQLIEKCYINCPDNELCKYLYEAYNGENEMLLYYEDIEDTIEFIS